MKVGNICEWIKWRKLHSRSVLPPGKPPVTCCTFCLQGYNRPNCRMWFNSNQWHVRARRAWSASWLALALRDPISELHGRDGQKRTGTTKRRSLGRDGAALAAYGENQTFNRLNGKDLGGLEEEEASRCTIRSRERRGGAVRMGICREALRRGRAGWTDGVGRDYFGARWDYQHVVTVCYSWWDIYTSVSHWLNSCVFALHS